MNVETPCIHTTPSYMGPCLTLWALYAILGGNVDLRQCMSQASHSSPYAQKQVVSVVMRLCIPAAEEDLEADGDAAAAEDPWAAHDAYMAFMDDLALEDEDPDDDVGLYVDGEEMSDSDDSGFIDDDWDPADMDEMDFGNLHGFRVSLGNSRFEAPSMP